MSLSVYKIVLDFEGLEIEAVLNRKYSPIVIERLVRSLPLEARTVLYGDSLICLVISTPLGVEKPRSEVKRGDLFYWPKSNCLGIALGDEKLAFKVSLLGSVDGSKMEALRGIKSGTKVKMRLKEDT